MNNALYSKTKSLLNGTIIYFIGNVLTQLISLLLLKLITNSIGAAEYGYFSLVIIIDNLITPIITLQISDAVFRFFIISKTDSEKKSIISSGLLIIGIGIISISALMAIFSSFFKYPFLVLLYVISTNMFAFLQKVVRSLGYNKQYVTANIIKSFLYCVLILFFIIKRHMGIDGLFIANCLSTYVCILYLTLKIKLTSYIDRKFICINTIKKMILFSAPLIPNTAIWWLQSSVNSLIISTQLGLESNGIYSIAIKFASVLHLVTNVFDLAWQESAIREHGTPDYKKFVTEIFDKYIIFILSTVAVLIPLFNIIGRYIIDRSYHEAISYIPFFLLSTAFAACSGFFAQLIVAQNKNIKLLYTNIMGAVINVVVILLLFRFLGFLAIALSAIATYAIVAYTRFEAVKDDFVKNEFNTKTYSALFFMVIIAFVATKWINPVLQSIILLLFLAITILFNEKLIRELLCIVLKKA